MADEYALGERPNLEDAIDAVVGILGMQPCEGTDAVPPNARCAPSKRALMPAAHSSV